MMIPPARKRSRLSTRDHAEYSHCMRGAPAGGCKYISNLLQRVRESLIMNEQNGATTTWMLVRHHCTNTVKL